MRSNQYVTDEQARVHINIPILIKGKNAEGKAYAERTMAENMTRRGVFIRTSQPLVIGNILRLYSAEDASHAIAKLEVVWVRDADDTQSQGIGAKLLGSNRQWINYLVDNSMTLESAEGEGADEDGEIDEEDE
ncbi:MAG: hypothetical protein HY774_01150 [Acidobacteria bacterium]|nr:hypothetical protein [Acidobacteriota bacterium]